VPLHWAVNVPVVPNWTVRWRRVQIAHRAGALLSGGVTARCRPALDPIKTSPALFLPQPQSGWFPIQRQRHEGAPQISHEPTHHRQQEALDPTRLCCAVTSMANGGCPTAALLVPIVRKCCPPHAYIAHCWSPQGKLIFQPQSPLHRFNTATVPDCGVAVRPNSPHGAVTHVQNVLYGRQGDGGQ